MKTCTIILLFSAFVGCTEHQTSDWRGAYRRLEKSRAVKVEKFYNFVSGDYQLTTIDSTITTFDEQGRKLGINNSHFYQYDSTGRLVAEDYCLRTCEVSGKELYQYDNSGRLVKKTVVLAGGTVRTTNSYYYNEKNQLIKEVTGSDSTPTIKRFTYDSLNRQRTAEKREFNTNVNNWRTQIDSIYYDAANNITLRKSWQLDEDHLSISKYYYRDTLLITRIDTAITSIPGYMPTPETSYAVDFCRTDFKYDARGRVIEKIVTGPDYKTPNFKITYEYRD